MHGTTVKITLFVFRNIIIIVCFKADPSSRAVWGVGLRPLAYWDCGFESRRGHECLVCCQVEISASGRSLVQKSPTVCGVLVWSRNLIDEV